MPAWRAALAAGLFLPATILNAQYVGSEACRSCHAERVALQSKTGHAHALAKAAAGSPGDWAFGAGAKAITWVTQVDQDTYAELGLSYFTATKSKGLTPGHDTAEDVRYRTFDPAATTLKCFRCHSTGSLSLGANDSIQPRELGIHCESCHGPGGRHVAAGGQPGAIFDPKRLGAVELNDFCGACHRSAPETDWTDKWRTRHQPSYLAQAACFRKSSGALTCLTCHDPHAPLNQVAAQYDKRCVGCHTAVQHSVPLAAGRACVDCHMPQVTINSQLKFTNHWIGIYTKGGPNLVPARSVVKNLPPVQLGSKTIAAPADPSNLRPLFEQALADREKELGPNHRKVAKSASDLGLFLANTGDAAGAETPLRRALAIDRGIGAAEISEDAENLGRLLADAGRGNEAIALFQEAASGPDPKIAARSLANLALLDPARAEQYYRGAIDAQQRSDGRDSKSGAILLNNLATVMQQKKDYKSAESLLRKALAIQKKILGPDSPAAASTMSNLGSLLETMGAHAEAEQMERGAVRIFEQKLGPSSAELATSCTNLADILWTKGDRASAGSLYKRAISIDESVYGLENPEVAGDLVNYGTLLKESGQPSAAEPILRRALGIYEKTLGPASSQAAQVRQLLAGK
jgi:tetratricopeptide (TPR) repeat protein